MEVEVVDNGPLTPAELALVVAHLKEHSEHHVDAEHVPAYHKVMKALEREGRKVDDAEKQRLHETAAVKLLERYWRGVKEPADMTKPLTTDQVLQVLNDHEPGSMDRETLIAALRRMGAGERLYSNEIYWLLTEAA